MQGLLPQGFGAAPQGIAGLLAGLVGGQGAADAGAQGLPGLFASLINGNGGAADKALSESDLAALLVSLKDIPGVELPEEMFTQMGGVGCEACEMQVNIQVVMVHIQQTITTLQQNGIALDNLGGAGELAAAFVQLGMDPAEAAVKATQIETMLKLLKEALDLDTKDDSTLGGLMAMVAASSTSLTPLTQQTMTVDVTQVDIEIATAVVQRAGVAAFGKLQQANPTDLARGLAQAVGHAGKAVPGVEQMPVADDALLLAEAPADGLEMIDPAKVVSSLQAQLDAKKVMDGDDEAASLPAVATPAVSRADVPAQAVVQPQAVQPVVTPVAVSKVLEAPRGLEIARMVDTADGVGGLERKVPSSEVRDMEPSVDASRNFGLEASGPAKLESSAAVVTTTFADKLAQATRADVTQQAVVQLKGLAGQGGGVIRMMLNPPELGQITIELVVRADKVEGSIAATDNAVVELLARDVHSLRTGLADAGLKLGDQGLSLLLNQGNQNFSQQSGGQGHNPQGQNHQTATWLDDGDVEDSSAATSGWVSPERVVDVRI